MIQIKAYNIQFTFKFKEYVDWYMYAPTNELTINMANSNWLQSHDRLNQWFQITAT